MDIILPKSEQLAIAAVTDTALPPELNYKSYEIYGYCDQVTFRKTGSARSIFEFFKLHLSPGDRVIDGAIYCDLAQDWTDLEKTTLETLSQHFGLPLNEISKSICPLVIFDTTESHA
jgi:hypothetical protein